MDEVTHARDNDSQLRLDVGLLLAAGFVRMLAFGSWSVILAIYLSCLARSPVEGGQFFELIFFEPSYSRHYWHL